MTDYYIDNVDGDDSANGTTFVTPVRTTLRLRDLLGGTASGGDTINFAPGSDYYWDNDNSSIAESFGSGTSASSRLLIQSSDVSQKAVFNQGMQCGAGAVFTDGLLAAYEMADTDFEDVSGNGHSLSKASTAFPVITASGAEFGAAQATFADSANDTERLVATSFRPLSNKSNFTIAGKVTNGSGNVTHSIAAQWGSAGNRSWRLRMLSSDDKLRFYYSDDGTDTDGNEVATGALNSTTFSFAVVCINNVLRIFIDGEDRTDGASSIMDGPLYNTNTDLIVGGDTAGDNFVGSIDYLTFYDRGLDSGELRQLAATGHTGEYHPWEVHSGNVYKAKVFIENDTSLGYSDTRIYRNGEDIYKPGENGNASASDVTVEGEHWLDSTNNYVYFYSSTAPSLDSIYLTSGSLILAGVSGTTGDYTTYVDLEAKYSTGNGFRADYATDVVYFDVYSHHNNYGGISVSTASTTVKLQYCNCSWNDHAGGFQNAATNDVILEGNIIDNNWRQSWAVEEGAVLMSGNRFSNTKTDLASSVSRSIQIGGTDVTVVDIYNNTFSSSEKSCVDVLSTFDNIAAALTAKYNIFESGNATIGASNGDVVIHADVVGNVTLDNNLYSSAAGTGTVIRWGVDPYATVAAFNTAETPQEDNGIDGDPDLDTDYSPKTGSPALGVGVKWWSGVTPVTSNGEPLPSYDIDLGGAQSTLGPFHPVNL